MNTGAKVTWIDAITRMPMTGTILTVSSTRCVVAVDSSIHRVQSIQTHLLTVIETATG